MMWERGDDDKYQESDSPDERNEWILETQKAETIGTVDSSR